MKLWATLSRIGDLFRYLRTWRKRRLYQQWVEKAGLPSEAIPREEFGAHIIREKEERDKQRLPLPILYILLGACLVVLCAILILLIIQS